MTKKLTHWLLTIIATALTLVMLCGTLGALRGMSASAAEGDDPTPIPAPSGWYVMGNGAGEQGLKNCNWTEFKSAFRLEGEAMDDVNYLGSWYTNKLALYQNDQFKLLYSDGALVGPTAEDSWAAKNVADYYTISEDFRANFICGVYGNIRIAAGFEGWYTFYLDVYEENGEVQKILTYEFDNETPLPEINVQYEMYVVGTIASDADVGWPGQEGKTMIEMSPREVEVENEVGEIVTVTKYYSHQIYFNTTDEIKVYNIVDDNYYPDGLNNAILPAADGWFVVEWEETAPSFELRACDENGAPYWPELDVLLRT